MRIAKFSKKKFALKFASIAKPRKLKIYTIALKRVMIFDLKIQIKYFIEALRHQTDIYLLIKIIFQKKLKLILHKTKAINTPRDMNNFLFYEAAVPIKNYSLFLMASKE